MIFELLIRNFVLIDEVRIEFKPGLNIFTGETGAGKSIMIKAIDIALGEKADKAYLRPGAEKAEVELAFHIDDAFLLEKLRQRSGLPLEEGLVTFKREIYESGRTVSRLNGEITNIATIRELAALLIDIHGQHEHQSLLKKENYLPLLDRFISTEHAQKAQRLSNLHASIRSLDETLRRLKESVRQSERESDFLLFQLREINDAQLVPEEDDTLMEEYLAIKNGETIHEKSHLALSLMAPDFDNPCTVLDLMDKALSALGTIDAFSVEVSALLERLRDLHFQLEDAVGDLGRFADHFNYDEERLDYVEGRLDLLNDLKRKYGNTLGDILSHREAIEARLSERDHSNERIEALEDQRQKAIEAYHALARSVSAERQAAASILEEAVMSQLKALNLEKAVFRVALERNPQTLSPEGYDRMDFTISTNPGQPLKTLSSIVSGGEISRIMLAIKVILSRSDGIGTLVFDEIDTGVSGRTARKVADKLFEASRHAQVLCITHLPQIAVMGDHHLLIEKVIEENATFTRVQKLGERQRVSEISRLLDGGGKKDISMDHAKRLIEASLEKKKAAPRPMQKEETLHEET